MLISQGNLQKDSLQGQVVLITGAGRGIGLEAARGLAWLGSRVVIAEVDPETGKRAAELIQAEFGGDRSLFVETDVGSESSVAALQQIVQKHYGSVEVVINNATITPMGAVADLPITDWDASYRVNLRGPVLLARAFLPGMIERDSGVFACVSSVGQACMGAYECFKVAQVHLVDTLDAELEGTGVAAFTIAPGLVRTPGALAGIQELAPLYGMSVEDFFNLSKYQIISPEAAGAGFAAAVALAEKFRGQEISVHSVLAEAGITLESPGGERGEIYLVQDCVQRALLLTESIYKTLDEQSKGWKNRGLFERQWMIRDFRKHAGMPVEGWLEALTTLSATLEGIENGGSILRDSLPPLDTLASYYQRLKKLAAGYGSDPRERQTHQQIISGWQQEVELLVETLVQR